MSLKIFHTGDIHLGMKFTSYPEGIRDILSEARYLTLETMINKANEINCNLFVVAGDLFNTTQIGKRDIDRTVNILDKFLGNCVLVMPGNHDYDNGMVELWKQFNSHHRENILYLGEMKAFDLEDYGLDVIVYPAPCHAKHSQENNLQWIKDRNILEIDRYHIGIAHGALEGISPDLAGEYFYMGKEELEDIPMDVWLLGHTHVSFPTEEKVTGWKVFNAGTPEPDGLNFRHPGAAWIISIDKEKTTRAERLEIGKYRFFDKYFDIEEDNDLDNVKEWVLSGDYTKKIIRLNLSGRVTNDTYTNIRSLYNDLESAIVHLIVEDAKLRVRINEETINREFTPGSFPYEFLNKLIHDDESLQIAYDLIREE